MRVGLAVMAVAGAVGCGGGATGPTPALPQVTVSLTAEVLPAGACPTRPGGDGGHCISTTYATVSVTERAGVSTVIETVQVSVCRASDCRVMVPRAPEDGPPILMDELGTESLRFRDPQNHPARDVPDVVKATAVVASAGGIQTLIAEFRFAP